MDVARVVSVNCIRAGQSTEHLALQASRIFPVRVGKRFPPCMGYRLKLRPVLRMRTPAPPTVSIGCTNDLESCGRVAYIEFSPFFS